MNKNQINYILHLADNVLIHGHRLSEWCGHGPILEVDMALANIALDQIGAARSLYQYAAQIEGNGNTEDTYPYLRDSREFKNILLVELPNGNFADTIAKCFYFDIFQVLLYEQLQYSTDQQLAAIAAKSLKEALYHKRFSSEWVIRLGDGTDESKRKMQKALIKHWDYIGEMFDICPYEKEMLVNRVAVDVNSLKTNWTEQVAKVINEATLAYPLQSDTGWHQRGGKIGLHTEHLGFILAEMQYLQKTYPGAEW